MLVLASGPSPPGRNAGLRSGEETPTRKARGLEPESSHIAHIHQNTAQTTLSGLTNGQPSYHAYPCPILQDEAMDRSGSCTRHHRRPCRPRCAGIGYSVSVFLITFHPTYILTAKIKERHHKQQTIMATMTAICGGDSGRTEHPLVCDHWSPFPLQPESPPQPCLPRVGGLLSHSRSLRDGRLPGFRDVTDAKD